MTDTRFPIGPFAPPGQLDPAGRQEAIGHLEALPTLLAGVVSRLDPGDLERRYREGGWTVRQVIHHLADSHLNGYVRTKLALTESGPRIRTYEQAEWAELPDVSLVDPSISVALVSALHVRWVALFRSMDAAAFRATFVHPAYPRPLTIDDALANYAWHGRHHLAHLHLALFVEGAYGRCPP